MTWRLSGWCLLCLHFFFPEPYREQILAAQTIITSCSDSLLPFHIATAIVVLLYIIQAGDLAFEWSAFILHHVLVFIFVMTEYYHRKWRLTCTCALFWSIRWMNSSNIYLEHPFRGCLRCVLFGVLSARKYCWHGALRWCWIFFVHEFCYVCIPIQMLYEVYFDKHIINDEDIV